MNISRMLTASHLLWQTSVLIWALSSPLAALLHCAGWAAVFKKSRPMGGGDGGMAAEAFWQPLLNQSSSEALLSPWVTLVLYCSLAARRTGWFQLTVVILWMLSVDCCHRVSALFVFDRVRRVLMFALRGWIFSLVVWALKFPTIQTVLKDSCCVGGVAADLVY